MILRVRFQKAYMKWNPLRLMYMPVVSPVHVADLHYFKMQIGEEEVEWIPDPDNTAIAKASIDMCFGACKDLELGAIYSEPRPLSFNSDFNADFSGSSDGLPGDDWNNDFNSDFGAFRPRKAFSYHNRFKLFGYDLGNNYQTDNPDFVITFVTNNLGDWSFDFNHDFNQHPPVYASLIQYREPYTDNIHFYDASSYTDPTDIKWWFVTPENNTSLEDEEEAISVHENRNGVYCYKYDIHTHVMKTLMSKQLVQSRGCCGCSGSCSCKKETYELLPILHHYDEELQEYMRDWYGSNPELRLYSDCRDKCRIDIHTKNQPIEVKLFINYSRLGYFYVNDEKLSPLGEDQIVFKAYNKSGALVASETCRRYNVDKFTSGEYTWSFVPHSSGDHIVTAEITSFSPECEGKKKITRTCLAKEKILVGDFYKLVKESCNTYTYYNCTADEIDVKRYEYFVERKKGNKKLNSRYTIKPFDYITLSADDGIYHDVITHASKENHETFVFLCDIERCIYDVVLSFVESPCEDIANITKVQSMLALWNTLLPKYMEYDNAEYWSAEQFETHVQDLYTLQEAYNSLFELCNECLKLQDCGC